MSDKNAYQWWWERSGRVYCCDEAVFNIGARADPFTRTRNKRNEKALIAGRECFTLYFKWSTSVSQRTAAGKGISNRRHTTRLNIWAISCSEFKITRKEPKSEHPAPNSTELLCRLLTVDCGYKWVYMCVTMTEVMLRGARTRRIINACRGRAILPSNYLWWPVVPWWLIGAFHRSAGAWCGTGSSCSRPRVPLRGCAAHRRVAPCIYRLHKAATRSQTFG